MILVVNGLIGVNGFEDVAGELERADAFPPYLFRVEFYKWWISDRYIQDHIVTDMVRSYDLMKFGAEYQQRAI